MGDESDISIGAFLALRAAWRLPMAIRSAHRVYYDYRVGGDASVMAETPGPGRAPLERDFRTETQRREDQGSE